MVDSLRFPYSPEYLFLQLHERQGRSEEAAILAEEVLAKIDTKDFSDRSLSKANGEYARIAVVSSNSAAKKSLTWYHATSNLQRALRAMSQRYPLAKSENEAKLRGRYWQGVYEGQLSATNCLRDALHVFQTLEVVFPDNKEVIVYAQAIFALLQELSQTVDDQALLIFQIEEAPYSLAKESYFHFLRTSGFDQQKGEMARLNTVSVRFFIRSVEAEDWSAAKFNIQQLRQILQKDHSLQLPMMKQLLFAAAKLRRGQSWRKNSRHFAESAKKDEQLSKLVQEFTKNIFVGFDDGEAKPMSRREI